ncbi:MAG: M23 family peptidase, partial [Pseudomonadota bacterium]|nr:M23 family peptidase [Pseudomonadota bacterium]
MYQFNDIGGASGSGTAALSLDQAIFRPRVTRPAFGQKTQTPRRPLSELDLVVDLGQRIGSAEWLRGFATCAALCYAAWSLGPAMSPLPGAAPAPMPEAHFEEARALAISPLAFGADTGRRMAPTEAVSPLTESPERPIID